MIKIGIELNNVVRDINTQIVKYYKKDINKSFDDSELDMNVLNVIDSLPFEKKKEKYTFSYVDYPYEIFGCAKGTHRNMGVMLNNWIVELDDREDNEYDVSVFSLKENALTIQSSYFFLSKLGCRVRNAFFPKDSATMWDKCDIIITTNERVVNTKPEGKVVVLIKKSDNEKLLEKSDMMYDNFAELLEDEDFINKAKLLLSRPKSDSFTVKNVLNKIKKIFK